MYFQGQSRELSIEKDMLIGIKVLYSRQKKKARAISHFMKAFPRRVYQFTPEKVWINGGSDIKGNFIDVRHELDLERLRILVNKNSKH